LASVQLKKGANMATLVENVLEIEAPSSRRSVAVASATTIKSRVVELWPATIVGVGLGLSLAWTAGLFWLVYVMV
jgi:hypothetical protein